MIIIVHLWGHGIMAWHRMAWWGSACECVPRAECVVGSEWRAKQKCQQIAVKNCVTPLLSTRQLPHTCTNPKKKEKITTTTNPMSDDPYTQVGRKEWSSMLEIEVSVELETGKNRV